MNELKITRNGNGNYRINDGIFIVKDNIPEDKLFEEIEKASQDMSGHPELTFKITAIGQRGEAR